MIVEIVLPRSVPIKALWWVALGHARLIATALNIGTLGFFWWDFPRDQKRFYDEALDIDSNQKILMSQGEVFKADFKVKNLSKDDFARFSLCLAGLTHQDKEEERAPFERYLTGVMFAAKSDVHFSFLNNAYECFYNCLLALGTNRGELIDNNVDDFIASVASFVDGERRERLIETGHECEGERQVTLEDVVWIKTLCDYYITKCFQADEHLFLGKPSLAEEA